MIVKPDCIPCYLKQCLSTLRIAGVKESEIGEILYKAVEVIPTLSLQATPSENSSIALLKVYELINNMDPYYSAKKEWNEFALKNYSQLETFVESADDRLLMAFKIAVAGNIIDMGITPDFDINVALREITAKEFDYSDYAQFLALVQTVENVLILGDNSGEIVFDKVLVNELKRVGMNVVYSVKGSPILNDATMEDAVQVGMTDLCRVVSTGSGILGISGGRCSEEFLTVYKKADIVIAKGQANFESLEGSELAGGKTFFVLRAKCEHVAHCLGVSLGQIVLMRNRS